MPPRRKVLILFVWYVILIFIIAVINSPKIDLRTINIVLVGAVALTFVSLATIWAVRKVETEFLSRASQTKTFKQYGLSLSEGTIIGKHRNLGFSILPSLHSENGWHFNVTIYLPEGVVVDKKAIKPALKKLRVKKFDVLENQVLIADWRPKYPPFRRLRFDETFFGPCLAVLEVVEKEIATNSSQGKL